MTLKEATENGLAYWDFFVFIDGKQILIAGKREEHVYHFQRLGTMHIGKLSAPDSLESTAEGDGWYEFELGDGTLTVWPSEPQEAASEAQRER